MSLKVKGGFPIRLYGMSDDELERLKRKKMQEMQRRMASQEAMQAVQESMKDKPKEPPTDKILDSIFGDRAWEVWRAAREQFPKLIPQVEQALVDAVKQGKIAEKIDGGGLAMFLRQIGLPLRLNTQIRFAEHGELKTLEQKLKSNE
jgi:programmed cell death protein 5